MCPKHVKLQSFRGSGFFTRMLCSFCPPTIWATSLEKSPRIVGGQHVQSMRVKISDPQKTRTLHFPESWAAAEGGGKTYRVNLGGETYCRVCSPKPLLEASGMVWSVPLSFKGNDRESPKKGGGNVS